MLENAPDAVIAGEPFIPHADLKGFYGIRQRASVQTVKSLEILSG